MKKLIYLFASLALVAAVVACGEKDGEQTEKPPIEEPEEETQIELNDQFYYVVGANAQQGIDVRDDGTANAGAYLFISENLQDTVYVSNRFWDKNDKYFYGISNLFDGIFDFPAEIMPGNICGFTFFPGAYRYEYKVEITSCRSMTADEIKATIDICNAMIAASDIHPNKFVIVKSLSKIE